MMHNANVVEKQSENEAALSTDKDINADGRKENLNNMAAYRDINAEPMLSEETHEVMQELIRSIAMEQRAIAQLLQAEANYIQVFTDVKGHQGGVTDQAEMDYFQSIIARIVEGIVEKQKLNLRLIELSKTLLKENHNEFS